MVASLAIRWMRIVVINTPHVTDKSYLGLDCDASEVASNTNSMNDDRHLIIVAPARCHPIMI